jgi:predicted DNA-binding protein
MDDKQNKIPLSIKIEPALLERIDKLAGKADLTRSKFITNIIEASVDALEDCQKVGIFQITLLLRDFEESMKAWSGKWRDKKVDIKG